VTDLIGHPWKPSATRSGARARIRSERHQPVTILGLRPEIISGIVILILLGGVATALFAYHDVQERQRVVAEERDRFAAYLAEREEAFATLPGLTRQQLGLLRRSLNPQHVQAARRLGISSVATRALVADRVKRGDLVRLDETETFWVSPMRHSVPYVTPDAAAAIDRIGLRFHERLAERRLPPIQFTITSVLRTGEDQARLRRTNVNAARGASAHEFATTFDVHYRNFRYAADPRAEIAEALGPLPYKFLYDEFSRELEAFYGKMAARYTSRIGAELGRALIDLENQGKMLAIREARQPVYHVTVARRLAN
jgi:hypothetical protein